jgi:hypothetical protein
MKLVRLPSIKSRYFDPLLRGRGLCYYSCYYSLLRVLVLLYYSTTTSSRAEEEARLRTQFFSRMGDELQVTNRHSWVQRALRVRTLLSDPHVCMRTSYCLDNYYVGSVTRVLPADDRR